MILSQLFVIIVIGVPLVFVAFNKLRVDTAGLVIALLLGLGQFFGLHLLGSTQADAVNAIAGFGQPVIITLLSLFIITYCLDKYGITRWIAARIVAIGGKSERRLIVLFAATAALLSLIMNNLAAGALLLPSALEAARRSGVKPSKLLIPVSYGTLLGGASTYFTTANIIVSGLLTTAQPPQQPLNILDFTPVGGLITLASLAFIWLFGSKLLPERESPMAQTKPTGDELGMAYQLRERLWEATVRRNSPLIGKTLAQSGITDELGLAVAEVWRGRQTIIAPAPDFALQREDELILVGREERIRQLEDDNLEIHEGHEDRLLHARGITLVEILLMPRSEVEDKTLKSIGFHSKYGFTAVALWRDDRSFRTDVADFRLHPGDSLLVVGPEHRLNNLRKQEDFIVLEPVALGEALDMPKVALVIGITFGAIAASIAGMPTYLAMLAGALLVFLTRLLTPDEAYRIIEWRAIFLIAGMFSISTAMIETGLAAMLGNGVVSLVAPYGGLGFIAGVYLLTVALTHFMGGQVTALVTGPIAISAALQLNVNPQAAAVAVAIACSTAFLTPMAHPVNVLMMTPGNYRFSDFLRLGVFLTVICFVMLLVGMVVFWGIR